MRTSAGAPPIQELTLSTMARGAVEEMFAEARPRWSFTEIEQPPQQFVLRLRSGQKEGEGPTAALIAAEGLRWQHEAMTRIAAFLREALPDALKDHVLA